MPAMHCRWRPIKDSTWRGGVLILAFACAGCAARNESIDPMPAPSSQPAPTLVDLPTDADPSVVLASLLPARIDIQRYLTQARAFDESPDVNGVECLLAAVDSAGDAQKLVGEVYFELYTRRPASGDVLGDRVGFWRIELPAGATPYWDRFARFYRFELRTAGLVPAGRYVLQATYLAPNGSKLFDQYEFESLAPIVSPARVPERS